MPPHLVSSPGKPVSVSERLNRRVTLVRCWWPLFQLIFIEPERSCRGRSRQTLLQSLGEAWCEFCY